MSLSNILCSLGGASFSGFQKIDSNSLWSVSRITLRPYTCVWNFCASYTIANSSHSTFAYIFSEGVNVFQLKATALSSCMITAPRPVLLASTLSTVSLLLLKYPTTGALVMTGIKSLLLWFLPHKCYIFLGKLWNWLLISALCSMILSRYLTVPSVWSTPSLSEGGGISLIAWRTHVQHSLLQEHEVSLSLDWTSILLICF